MKICVQGIWHLGSVTSACLAAVGHEVCGLDPDVRSISMLNEGEAPIFEPGLDELVVSGLKSGRLKFSSNVSLAVKDAQVLWVTFDTPVNDEDQADVPYVENQIRMILPHLNVGTVVLVSSQLPVGSIRLLEQFAQQSMPEKRLLFACSPENLRLGKALEVFLKPDRIVVGVRSSRARNIIWDMLRPVTDRIEWMSVESAEMTKHAINAFLATSVAFANEIAAICELVGADAKQVERGLKTESRIGPKAYLSPGGAFAGGTLARDIEFLGTQSRAYGLKTPLLTAVRPSNDEHKNWARRKLLQCFGTVHEVTISVWGLTYKPGTNTLRRSLAVELCDWLIGEGASLKVYDPEVKELPERWRGKVVKCSDPLIAVKDARALIVGTEWEEFKEAAIALPENGTVGLVIIDANRHLSTSAIELTKAGFSYLTVGSYTPVGDMV